jgi:hypothetical protein
LGKFGRTFRAVFSVDEKENHVRASLPQQVELLQYTLCYPTGRALWLKPGVHRGKQLVSLTQA